VTAVVASAAAVVHVGVTAGPSVWPSGPARLSVGLVLSTVTFAVAAAEPPVASVAVAETAAGPSASVRVSTLVLNGGVSNVWNGLPRTRNTSCVTPALSVAVAVSGTTPRTAAPSAGDVNVATGATVSTKVAVTVRSGTPAPTAIKTLQGLRALAHCGWVQPVKWNPSVSCASKDSWPGDG